MKAFSQAAPRCYELFNVKSHAFSGKAVEGCLAGKVQRLCDNLRKKSRVNSIGLCHFERLHAEKRRLLLNPPSGETRTMKRKCRPENIEPGVLAGILCLFPMGCLA